MTGTSALPQRLNEFIFVLRRGNYIVPARRQRSFPLVPRRETVLA